ncbi:MAG: ABC transporter permease [Longimonas sp.]|uniref:ABC transporter permease n=1 Tax=Longimonas sp. TaxID=2039626 RepID=UPI00397475D7
MNPARLLRIGAFTFVLIGGGITAWLIDKAIRYPDIRAAQFGFEAPYWPALIAFVMLCTGIGAYMQLRAARRVEEGEDLYAQRHRRHPSEKYPDEYPDQKE